MSPAAAQSGSREGAFQPDMARLAAAEAHQALFHQIGHIVSARLGHG